MRVIHKFAVGTGEPVTHHMPTHSVIMHTAVMVDVDRQPGVYFWAFIDSEMPTTTRKFQVIATGEPQAELIRPVGTAIYGNVVLHLVEFINVNKPLPVGIGEEMTDA